MAQGPWLFRKALLGFQMIQWLKDRKWMVTAIISGVIVLILGFLFELTLEKTNTLEFCISCHEMESTVYQEYKESSHYSNASGVRAICSDCHVPKPLIPKLIRKAKAVNELYHWAFGTIDTPEKFEAKREELAIHVWEFMEQTDSLECRNCHSYDAMNFHEQSRRAKKQMETAKEDGKICIECHKGLVHKLPVGYEDD